MNISRLLKCRTIFCHELNTQFPLRYNISKTAKLFNYRNYCAEKVKSLKLLTSQKVKLRSTKNYFVALTFLTLGAAYAAVPLYTIFCQTSGYGGTTQHDLGGEKIHKMVKKPYRKISVKFVSDTSTNLKWEFKPQQKEVVVVPGETALAFYTATNPSEEPITGISTYNVLPFEAASYFNKIQCFCFEEQQLNPKEKVDMPVFFYIDPEFCEDPLLENINEIILSYTFFEAKDGFTLPWSNSSKSNK